MKKQNICSKCKGIIVLPGEVVGWGGYFCNCRSRKVTEEHIRNLLQDYPQLLEAFEELLEKAWRYDELE